MAQAVESARTSEHAVVEASPASHGRRRSGPTTWAQRPDHPADRDLGRPAALADDPVERLAEQLRVAGVRARAR